MYSEKATVRFYYEKEKIQEKRTSLIPRVGDVVVINGKSYVVIDVVWFDSNVEVYLNKTVR